MGRKWGFHSVVLASGASPLEQQAREGLVALLAADPERSSWQRTCSYRVVERAQLESEVRAAAVAERVALGEDEPPGDVGDSSFSIEPAEQVAEASDGAVTAPALATAFQQLVDRDKREFEQFLIEVVSVPGVDEGSAKLSGSPSASVLPVEEAGGTREPPARIYLLLDYPNSLEEIDALLRLGELDSERTRSNASLSDALPLLPLIDGALLLVDALKGLHSRRKGSSVGNRRTSGGSPTKFDDLDVLDAFVPPSALPPSPFVTSNPSVSAFYTASGVGGLEWSDFTFTDVACTRIDPDEAPPVQLKPVEDLLSEVVGTLERLAADKLAFKGWVQATTVYSLPAAEPQAGSAQRLFRKYHRVLRPSFPASVSVSTVVFALREAIAQTDHDEENGAEDADDEELGENAARQLLDSYHQVVPPSFQASVSVSTVVFALREAVARAAAGDKTFRNKEAGERGEPPSDSAQRLLGKYHRALPSSFPPSVSVSTVVFSLREVVADDYESGGGGNDGNDDDEKAESDAGLSDASQLFVEYGDEAAKRVARAWMCRDALRLQGDPSTVGGVGIAEIERAMWQASDLPGVGNNGRKAFPVAPTLSPVERGVLETEFASFCPQSLCVPHVHLTRQLLQLEELLGATWKGKVQTRELAELLNARVFPQRLAQVLLRAPTVHKAYYPPTDALLLACITATAPGRFRAAFWSAREHVRHRPAFKEWKKERAVAPEYLTPRAAEAVAACVPLSSTELEAVAEKSWVFYPEDHSVVRLQQSPRGDTWLSVYQGRNVFGLRPLAASSERESPSTSGSGAIHAMQFTASFDDESRLHICEGRRQFPRKPDGFSTVTVTNSFPCGLSISTGSDGSIVQRYIRCDVGRTAGGGDAEDYRVIYGRGCVLRVLGGGAGQVLTPEGAVYSVAIQPDGTFQRTSSVAQPTSIFTVDPETNALVERRSTGVVIATHTDGARITYHVDGTRMYSNAQGTHVAVHKRSFADVAIDLNVNLTAQRHASGERVAVTKGGLRTRSTVTVYDGTGIDVAYNTKVTAQVNGRVTTSKPDGTVVVAKDSGRVEYLPSDSRGFCVDEDNDRDVVNHNGVYYFDIRLGRFELCDREHNVFLIETGDGSTAPRASVDLAGVISEAEAQRYSVEQLPVKATINDPIQPHVFILNGDGTALEILTPRDVVDCLNQVSAASKALSPLSNDQQEKAPLQLPHEFLASLVVVHPWVDCGPSAPIFNDEALSRHLASLRRPVATAGKHLTDYFAEFESPSSRRFTVARRLWSLQPLSSEQVGQMQSAWDAWKQWQDEREATMDRFKVDDPRDADAVAQEAAMQKRVLAAYKAARGRKKLERQEARELKLAAASKGAQMETVPEGAADEEKDEEQADGEDDEDDFDQFGSEASDDDGCHDGGADTDDPMALQWVAFSQADDAGSGVLTMTQTRQALVNALGTGVTTAELSNALSKRFRVDASFKARCMCAGVSFDLFVDLAEYFKRLEDEPSEGGPGDGADKRAVDSVPRLLTPSAPAFGRTLMQTTFKPSLVDGVRQVAVGSGARAVRQRQALADD